MRKYFALLLAFVMTCASAAPVFADNSNSGAPTDNAQFAAPLLKLEVRVNNFIKTDESLAEKANVIYTAQLNKNFILADSNIARPIYIDFYYSTGNMLTVYPNEYLGRAAVNNNGIAQLKVYQRPGEYAGGAIWVRTSQGKVFSNVVRYKVPSYPPVPPTNPQLKLEVFTNNKNSSSIARYNVTYKVTLLRNYIPLSYTDSNVDLAVWRRRVDFYTGAENSSFPDKYIGSAQMDMYGNAKISFYQDPGKYTGGAIYIIDNTGSKIYSNVVTYEVKPCSDAVIKPEPEPEKPVSVERRNSSNNAVRRAKSAADARPSQKANTEAKENVIKDKNNQRPQSNNKEKPSVNPETNINTNANTKTKAKLRTNK